MTTKPAWWARLLRLDEANHAYFAERVARPWVTLFWAERADAPEFDAAWIYDVPPAQAEPTLDAVIAFYRERDRPARVRLSPLSTPGDWPERLVRAGFRETDDQQCYFVVPETVALASTTRADIRRAISPHDADCFSAVQVAGFGIPPEHREWDRALARRHLAAGDHRFYLALVNGQAVGAARCLRGPDGTTALAALTTLPAARGQGVGTGLLARMIADARAEGAGAIFGAVVPGSYAAGMYARLGFASLYTTRTFAADSAPGRTPRIRTP